MTNKTDILVSVCCVTYNHINFIRECLEGITNQITTFPIEIIIHDDASTDGTADIIREFSALDSRIIPILRESNIKSTGVSVFPITYNLARGKYIAICEGDDYWTDPYKLQKQVEYLETHSNVSMVSHQVKIFDQREGCFVGSIGHKNKTGALRPDEIIMGGGYSIPTCSVVFSSKYFKAQPKWYTDMSVGDYALYLLMISFGEVHHLNFYGGVYRFDVSGKSWSSEFLASNAVEKRIRLHANIIQSLRGFDSFTKFKYKKNVMRAIQQRIMYIFMENPDQTTLLPDLAILKTQLLFPQRIKLFLFTDLNLLFKGYTKLKSIIGTLYRRYFIV